MFLCDNNDTNEVDHFNGISLLFIIKISLSVLGSFLKHFDQDSRQSL